MGRFPGLQLPTDSPRVQLQNKVGWNGERSRDDADFYTVGYSGRHTDDVLHALTVAGVSALVDVRHTPISMYKPDFSKRNLIRHLEAHGIEYVHFPDLGIPRDVRALVVGKPNRDDLWEWYDANVAESFAANLHRFFNATDHPVAMMCTELDPTACHRHRLCLALERKGLRGFDL